MDDFAAQIQPHTAQRISNGSGIIRRDAPDETSASEGGFFAQLGAQLSGPTAIDGPLIGMLLATTGSVQNIGGRLGSSSRGIGRHGDGGGRASATPNLAQLASAELASSEAPEPNPAQSTNEGSQRARSRSGSRQSAGNNAPQQRADSGTQVAVTNSTSKPTSGQSSSESPGQRFESAGSTVSQGENERSGVETSQRVDRPSSLAHVPHDGGASKLNQTRTNVAATPGGAVRGISSVQSGSSMGLDGRGTSGGPDSQARGAKHAARTAHSARPRSFQLEQKAFNTQLSTGLAAALKRSGGTVTMRLTPHALGFLRIRLEVREGVVRARFETSTNQARHLLEQNMTALRTSLEDKGLHVEKLSVRLIPQPGQEGSSGSSQDAGQGEDEAGESGRGEHGEAQRSAAASAARQRGVGDEDVDQAELGLLSENPSETEFERDEHGYVLHLDALA